MSDELQGRVALITGAGSGMGRAAALVFAAAGARVVVADRNREAVEETEAAVRSADGIVAAVEADISSEDSVKEMMVKAKESFGRVDCAFNNAGVPAKQLRAAEYDLAAWQKTVSINLTGSWLCMKYELVEFERNGGGAIVNNASAWGLVGWPLAAPYVASKHGVIGLTKAAALDYGKSGVRINAVCPGLIETPMSRGIIEDSALLEQQPLGRVGQPEEVARAALWLCSDAASFVTGTAMLIDGGWNV